MATSRCSSVSGRTWTACETFAAIRLRIAANASHSCAATGIGWGGSTRFLLSGSAPDPVHLVQHRVGHDLLRGPGDPSFAVWGDDHHLVLAGIESDVLAGDVIDDDGVQSLSFQLAPPVFDGAGPMLGGEPHQHLPRLSLRAQRGQDVLRT